ncbi:MAG: hypothetical protein JWQ24_3181 [Tardiphaga sp.]|nr:hypothetical protein [Tardiphaga sp.]
MSDAAPDNLEIVIYWRPRNRFEWEIADGAAVVYRGKESSVELARSAAGAALLEARAQVGPLPYSD